MFHPDPSCPRERTAVFAVLREEYTEKSEKQSENRHKRSFFVKKAEFLIDTGQIFH